MANVRKIIGANGIAYKITVTRGLDSTGKQVRHYKTFNPPSGMGEKRAEKEAQRLAVQFENEIQQGYQLDNRQTFAEYAAYVLDLKKRNGLKQATYERYVHLLERTNIAIGHIKLADLRPQHLNAFYKNLSEEGIRTTGSKATPKADIRAVMKARGLSMERIAEKYKIGASTISAACRGRTIDLAKADVLAKALGGKTKDLFTVQKNMQPLAQKTVLEYHRLIRSVLTQAEKEMLVPYNAAQKATPPKVPHHEVNYFQPEQIVAILDALEQEPIKWRTITHLMIVTGCRRGEIMGLKWDKIDLENRKLRIDTSLLYSVKLGLYETTTKTGDIRNLTIPAETVSLLRQYRARQAEVRLANGDRWQDSGFVFTRDNGAPMSPQSIGKWLTAFSERHGLPHINPHAFRHTVASMLIANGTDVVTVSKQLGHASVATTESFYSHIIEENLSKASECIADVMLRRDKAK